VRSGPSLDMPSKRPRTAGGTAETEAEAEEAPSGEQGMEEQGVADSSTTGAEAEDPVAIAPVASAPAPAEAGNTNGTLVVSVRVVDPSVLAAAEAEAERLADEEGLWLVPADTTGGFRGVKLDKNCRERPYYAQVKVGGKCTSLGYYATAKEAALAYARAKGQKKPPESTLANTCTDLALVARETEIDRLVEAEGLRLIAAPELPSGYKGVKHHKDSRHRLRPYEARTWAHGRTKSLGRFPTAKEAALAYARAKAAGEQDPPPPALAAPAAPESAMAGPATSASSAASAATPSAVLAATPAIALLTAPAELPTEELPHAVAFVDMGPVPVACLAPVTVVPMMEMACVGPVVVEMGAACPTAASAQLTTASAQADGAAPMMAYPVTTSPLGCD